MTWNSAKTIIAGNDRSGRARLTRSDSQSNDMREQCAQIVIRFDGKNSSGNKLPYLSPLTLPSPPLFPLRDPGGEGSGTGNLFPDES